jgi:hypothetical protein
MGEVRETLLRGTVRENRFIKSSQASLSRPSDKGSMKVKMLEWLEVVA